MSTRLGQKYEMVEEPMRESEDNGAAEPADIEKASLLDMLRMMLQDRQQHEKDRQRREEQMAEECERHEREAEDRFSLLQRQMEALERLIISQEDVR